MNHAMQRKKGLRAFGIYEAVALLTALFGLVYTHFGYGVTSFFMYYAFLFPLGGGLLYLLFAFAPLPYPSLAASRAIAYALAAFTLDFLITGVLDIAGAFSEAAIAMSVLGYLFAFAGVILYFRAFQKKKESPVKRPPSQDS